MLEMRLAFAWGMSLRQFRESVDSEEYPLWIAFLQSHGFPDSRLEAVIANSGAAICQTWGGKVKAKDFIPSFKEKKVKLNAQDSGNLLKAWVKVMTTKPTKGAK